MIFILEGLLLVILIGIAIAIIFDKDLLSCAIVYMGFSFFTMLLYILMGAADVAFTEAVIGVISTVYFILAIRSTDRWIREKGKKKKEWGRLLGLLLMGLVLTIIWMKIDSLPVIGDVSSAPNTHVSQTYIEDGYHVTGAKNIVTGILADFRGFDTLLETTVMLLSAMATSMILSNKLKKTWDGSIFGNGQVLGGVNTKVMAPLIIPVLMLYGLYVLFHGEVSLGGGFQAGALFALAYIMYTTVAGLEIGKKKLNQHFFICLGAVGVLIYFGEAVLAMVLGGNALEYSAISLWGAIGHTRHSIGILTIEIGVTITVMSSIITILQAVLERSSFLDRDEERGERLA